jgi:hypothetical protein
MLQRIEIVPTARSRPRRAITLGCELSTNDGTVRGTVIDLSPRGARVQAGAPVALGETALLSFAIERMGRRVDVLAEVAHVFAEPSARADASSASPPSIGLQFVGLDREVEVELAARLRGVPPPLPRPGASRYELAWIDDLGASELEIDASRIESLAPLVTGGVAWG